MLVAKPLQIKHQELLTLARKAKGSVDTLYLHWTAGRYGQAYDDYHLNVDKEGEIYKTCRELTDLKAHTWRRNSRAVGIAACCAYGAICGADAKPIYAADPPTELQINQMAVVIAILCIALELPIDFEHVRTHYEVAVADGYGPNSDDPDCRWDLSWLSGMPETRTLRPGGEMLRSRARYYRQFFLQNTLQVPQQKAELAEALFA